MYTQTEPMTVTKFRFLKCKMKMNSHTENKQLTINSLPTEKGSDQRKISCFQSRESTE